MSWESQTNIWNGTEFYKHRFEDLTCRFHDRKVFSKLDMKKGYHQLLLHQDSRAIPTFSTPLGNIRPKRLIFDAKSTQDLFNEAMFSIFGDIPKCLNQRDDILICGCTLDTHTQKILETLLQRTLASHSKEIMPILGMRTRIYGYRFFKRRTETNRK